MDTKDIADLFLAATGKIEFYWNFYTVTLIALIGWLVSRKQPFQPKLKLLITVGYQAFVLMNVLGLLGSYTFAEALRLDLLAAPQAVPDSLVHARDVLNKHSYDDQKILAMVIHAVLAVFVLGVIWFGRFGEKSSDKSD